MDRSLSEPRHESQTDNLDRRRPKKRVRHRKRKKSRPSQQGWMTPRDNREEIHKEKLKQMKRQNEIDNAFLYQIEYKKQIQARRLQMVRNYSDAELISMIDKKLNRKRDAVLRGASKKHMRKARIRRHTTSTPEKLLAKRRNSRLASHKTVDAIIHKQPLIARAGDHVEVVTMHGTIPATELLEKQYETNSSTFDKSMKYKTQGRSKSMKNKKNSKKSRIFSADYKENDQFFANSTKRRKNRQLNGVKSAKILSTKQHKSTNSNIRFPQIVPRQTRKTRKRKTSSLSRNTNSNSRNRKKNNKKNSKNSNNNNSKNNNKKSSSDDTSKQRISKKRNEKYDNNDFLRHLSPLNKISFATSHENYGTKNSNYINENNMNNNEIGASINTATFAAGTRHAIINQVINDPKNQVRAAKAPKSLLNSWSPNIGQYGNYQLNKHLLNEDKNGLGVSSNIKSLLFTIFYNKEIEIIADSSKLQIELNLSQYPEILNFSTIHRNEHRCIRLKSFEASIQATEYIEINKKEWPNILIDKRRPPKPISGHTSTLPLFIPCEQKSLLQNHTRNKNSKNNNNNETTTTNNHINNINNINRGIINHESELVQRQITSSVTKDVLQQLSAPNVHKMNQPPMYQIQQQEAALQAQKTLEAQQHARNLKQAQQAQQQQAQQQALQQQQQQQQQAQSQPQFVYQQTIQPPFMSHISQIPQMPAMSQQASAAEQTEKIGKTEQITDRQHVKLAGLKSESVSRLSTPAENRRAHGGGGAGDGNNASLDKSTIELKDNALKQMVAENIESIIQNHSNQIDSISVKNKNKENSISNSNNNSENNNNNNNNSTNGNNQFLENITDLIVGRISQKLDLKGLNTLLSKQSSTSSQHEMPNLNQTQNQIQSQNPMQGQPQAFFTPQAQQINGGGGGSGGMGIGLNARQSLPTTSSQQMANTYGAGDFNRGGAGVGAGALNGQQLRRTQSFDFANNNQNMQMKNNININGVGAHFEEATTQGARMNHTSIGSALLSVKMAGLNSHVSPSATATASVDPYNTAAANSSLVATEKFGPNVATHAHPPNANMSSPPLVNQNDPNRMNINNKFQFQSPTQITPQMNQMNQMTNINGMNNSMNNMNNMNPMNMNMAMMYNPAMMYNSMAAAAAMNAMAMNMNNPAMAMQFSPMMNGINGINGMNGIHNNGLNGISQSPRNRKGSTSRRDSNRDRRSHRSNATHRSTRLSRMSYSTRQRTTSERDSPNNNNNNTNSKGEDNVKAADIKDLFTKAINNRHNQVEELFASGIPANSKDGHGNTVLHVAAQNGNKRLIKVALRWGADINAQNKQLQTPLHYLFAYKYEELAAYLISKGADDTIQNQFGYSCYDGLRPANK